MIAIMSLDPLEELWRDHGVARQLGGREVLFRSGDPVNHLYRVVSGTVALIRPLPHGADLIIQRAGAGALLAEASMFARAYHCNAIALEPAQISSLPLTRVHAAVAARPALLWSLAHHLAGEVQKARALAEILSLKTVSMRLDAWLGLTGERVPEKGRRRDLAAAIGVSPEALYRELARRRGRSALDQA